MWRGKSGRLVWRVRSVEFFGEKFEVSEPAQFLLMEFAEAVDGADENGLPAAAAMMRLLRAAIPADDWTRFRKLAVANNAEGEHLMPLIERAVEQMDDRPTARSSDSSDGPDVTVSRSVSPAVAKALRSETGRPDRQMGILRSA